MPYDKKLGKMVWTKEDKIRAIVYLTVMFSILIGMILMFGSKIDNAIESGIVTEAEVVTVLEDQIMWTIYIAIGVVIFISILSIYLSWKENHVKGVIDNERMD